MRVEIYMGYGTQRRLEWEGELEIVPRLDEIVVLDKDGDRSVRIERVTHWPPFGEKEGYVELYGR